MSEEQAPAWAVPWQSKPPIAAAWGFKQASGVVVIALGYSVYKEAVGLYASMQIGGGEPQMWRSHWTSHIEAERSAENLCGDAMEYLRSVQAPLRPVEDLDYEDFLEHLHARLNNELH